MNPKLLDVLDRVGWTFVQALAGSFFAGGVAIAQHAWDWKAALTGAFTAAAICLFKVLGVNAAVSAKLREAHDHFDYEPAVDDVVPPAPPPPAPAAVPPPPVVAPAVKPVESTGPLPVVDAPPAPAPPSAGALSAAGAAEGF